MHVWERKEERKGTLTVPLVCQQAPGFTLSIFNAVICYTELKMITEGLFSPSPFPPLFLFRFIRLSFPIKTARLEFLTFTLSVRNVYLNQKKGENGKNKNQPLRKSSSFLSLPFSEERHTHTPPSVFLCSFCHSSIWVPSVPSYPTWPHPHCLLLKFFFYNWSKDRSETGRSHTVTMHTVLHSQAEQLDLFKPIL